jgi:hypothetical protein
MKAVITDSKTIMRMTIAARMSPMKYDAIAKVSSKALRGFFARPQIPERASASARGRSD